MDSYRHVVSLIGQIHLGLAVAALLSGTVVVALGKGTGIHRLVGFVYATSMLGLNGSALLIYNLTGSFGPFHVLALISLATVLIGVVYALLSTPRDRWIILHAYWMSWSYIGLLAATASEALTRLPSAPFWWAVAAASVLVVGIGGWAIAVTVPKALQKQFRTRT